MTVYLEVLDGKTLVKKPLCKIPKMLYEEFMWDAKASLNAYVSVWAKSDFALHSTIGTVTDVDKLIQKVQEGFKRSYPELYAVEDIEIDGNFWVSYWLGSHFKYEIEKRKLYDYSS